MIGTMWQQEDIYKNGGQGLLTGYYNGSPSKALLSVYPEHNWELERFKHKTPWILDRIEEKWQEVLWLVND